MKKDRNRSDLNNTDYSLPREKILRGRRNFERLFEKSTVLKNHSIQFRFRFYQDPAEGCYIGFIAPKKRFKSAVKRNRIKRILREAYRLNQDHFRDLFNRESFGLHAVFMANREGLSFEQVQNEMIPILKEAREKFMQLDRTKTVYPTNTEQNMNSETKLSK